MLWSVFSQCKPPWEAAPYYLLDLAFILQSAALTLPTNQSGSAYLLHLPLPMDTRVPAPPHKTPLSFYLLIISGAAPRGAPGVRCASPLGNREEQPILPMAVISRSVGCTFLKFSIITLYFKTCGYLVSTP